MKKFFCLIMFVLTAAVCMNTYGTPTKVVSDCDVGYHATFDAQSVDVATVQSPVEAQAIIYKNFPGEVLKDQAEFETLPAFKVLSVSITHNYWQTDVAAMCRTVNLYNSILIYKNSNANRNSKINLPGSRCHRNC
jgi:hypothetical protein